MCMNIKITMLFNLEYHNSNIFFEEKILIKSRISIFVSFKLEENCKKICFYNTQQLGLSKVHKLKNINFENTSFPNLFGNDVFPQSSRQHLN